MAVRPVLVINAGSSSLKYEVIDVESGERLARGAIERIGMTGGRLSHRVGSSDEHVVNAGDELTYADAMSLVFEAFGDHGPSLDSVVGVGHRVVHGGERFTEPALVDAGVLEDIRALSRLAPLHNPVSVDCIELVGRHLPGVPQVAVFDSAFHATIPAYARTYAIPSDLAEHHGIRKYGFHGTSVEYVTGVAADHLGVPRDAVNLIVCHLGNGASITAVRSGRSVDTSMGFSPLSGLVMGTRSGDLDPAVVTYLQRHAGLGADEVESLLNRSSGLIGLAGTSDMREVRARADAGDAAASRAREVYAYRIRCYIGAYVAVLPDLHGIVFTGGIGENDAAMRSSVCAPLGHLGMRIDEAANEQRQDPVTDIGAGALPVLVVETDEEGAIALHTERLVNNPPAKESA